MVDGTVDPQNVPDNSPGSMDYGWLGQHQRAYEHTGGLSLVQMGARPYSPLLGRFLSVDPVDGGSAAGSGARSHGSNGITRRPDTCV